jgi:peptidoglycan/LPS O-acetylase OafA/YrhL
MSSPVLGRSGSTIAFLTVLRTIAALCVVWDHVVGYWFAFVNPNWPPLKTLFQYVNRPLAIREDFGFFGVGSFFLVSGFIITHVAQREDRLTFGVKRLFRIYPALILSVIFIPPFLRISHGLFASAPGPDDAITLSDQFWSGTLLNIWFCKPAVNHVTWTLTIEILFYGLCLAFLPLIRRNPRLAVIVQLAVVAAICESWRLFGGTFVLMLSFTFSFLPYLLFGQIVYYLWSGRFRFRDYAWLSALNYILLIRGRWTFEPAALAAGNSQIVSFAYAYGVFIALMLVSDRIQVPAAVRGTAEISYSLYLWHLPIGRFVLGAMSDFWAPVALATAVAAAFAVSYLSWRFVERPSQELARRMLARWRPPPPSGVAPATILPRSSASAQAA